MTYQLPATHTPEAFCYHCGADWSNWHKLDNDERLLVLDKNPDAEVGNLEENCCPSCGFSYVDDADDFEYY